MRYTLVCEGFDPTPAIKAHVNENIVALEGLAPKNEMLHVFLSMPAPHRFHAMFKVLAGKKEVIARETEENLYHAVNGARQHMERRLRADRDKAREARRKPLPEFEDSP